MQPWEFSSPFTEEYLIAQWATLKPEDFCFALIMNDTGKDAHVCIVPSLYFINHAHMFNDSMPITHMLPSYLIEVQNSVFEVVGKTPTSTVYSDLLDIGFIHVKLFQNFIESTDASLIYGP